MKKFKTIMLSKGSQISRAIKPLPPNCKCVPKKKDQTKYKEYENGSIYSKSIYSARNSTIYSSNDEPVEENISQNDLSRERQRPLIVVVVMNKHGQTYAGHSSYHQGYMNQYECQCSTNSHERGDRAPTLLQTTTPLTAKPKSFDNEEEVDDGSERLETRNSNDKEISTKTPEPCNIPDYLENFKRLEELIRQCTTVQHQEQIESSLEKIENVSVASVKTKHKDKPQPSTNKQTLLNVSQCRPCTSQAVQQRLGITTNGNEFRQIEVPVCIGKTTTAHCKHCKHVNALENSFYDSDDVGCYKNEVCNCVYHLNTMDDKPHNVYCTNQKNFNSNPTYRMNEECEQYCCCMNNDNNSKNGKKKKLRKKLNKKNRKLVPPKIISEKHGVAPRLILHEVKTQNCPPVQSVVPPAEKSRSTNFCNNDCSLLYNGFMGNSCCEAMW